MSVEDRKNVLLDDTALPDVFICRYMMLLSETALKCYLYARLALKKGIILGEGELSSRLGVSTEVIQETLIELSRFELIKPWKKGEKLQFIDLKQRETDEYIYARRKSALANPQEPLAEDPVRIQLERSVEKTFFHGSMNTRWCICIGKYLDEYKFDSTVVYMLFQYCSNKKLLKWEKSVEEVAKRWAVQGVRTSEDLGILLAKDEQVDKIMKRLAKTLRRLMNQFDEEIISGWVNDLPYPYEIIELAVKKMCQYKSGHSLEEADNIIRLWFGMKLMDLPAILEFEKAQAKRNKIRYQENQRVQSTPERNRQNFKSVEYDEEQLVSISKGAEDYVARVRERRD